MCIDVDHGPAQGNLPKARVKAPQPQSVPMTPVAKVAAVPSLPGIPTSAQFSLLPISVPDLNEQKAAVESDSGSPGLIDLDLTPAEFSEN
jgi:hypothetical protein